MKTISIERKSGLSPADFARDHLDGVGTPVIVTDAMDNWPARRKWSFDFFKSAYGSDFGSAPLSFGGEVAKVTKVSSYIDHLDQTVGQLPGFWIETRSGKPLRAGPPEPLSAPYILGWHAFTKHPELYADIMPAPYFISDWVLALNPIMREIFERASGRDYWSLYIGPEGSLSSLHCDFWRTHGYLAQITGRKRALLFSPQDEPLLYDGQVDPEVPDLERFPLFETATAYECVIEPGEMLFMPAGWWHCVRAVEKSITVSHNFFNDKNVNEHLMGLMGKLPLLVQGFEKHPEWRAAMGMSGLGNEEL